MDFFLQQFVNGIVLGSALSLFALGFGLVLANLRIFAISHEAIFTWGAIVIWFCVVEGLPWILGAVVATVSAGILNVIVYATVIRHVQVRPDRELGAFVSSIGGLIILVALADVALDATPRGMPSGAFPTTGWDIGGVRIQAIEVTIIAAAVVGFGVLSWLVEKTAFGRQLRTVAFDRELAALLGVGVDRISAGVFLIAGVVAGIGAATLATAFGSIESEMGARFGLIAIAISVIGGWGSIRGTLVAGLGVGLVSTLTTGYLTTAYSDVVIFGAMLLVLLVRPHGLFATAEDTVRA